MKSPMDKAYRVTSPYGMRNLGGSSTPMHNGIDLVPQDGYHPTAIFAPCDGEITNIKSDVPDSHTGLNVKTDLAGNFIWLKTAGGYTIKYHHLKANSIPPGYVKGTKIKADQLIGVMGTTGCSTGVHLHYEFLDPAGKPFDPAPYMGNSLQFPNAQNPAPSPAPTNPPASGTIKLGSRVKVKSGAKTYTGGSIAAFVYNNTYTVDSLSNDRAVLDAKGICTAFNIKDLTPV